MNWLRMAELVREADARSQGGALASMTFPVALAQVFEEEHEREVRIAEDVANGVDVNHYGGDL